MDKSPCFSENLINESDYHNIRQRVTSELFKWMKSQNDFLTKEPEIRPLITSRENKGFKLDQDTRRRMIPDSLKNTLKEEDYLIIEHW